jgi:DNA-binding PadR family transcriptional regulator
MTGQAFHVLTALADGPRHGYGIVGDVAELSQGRVKLRIGGLYGVLERLAAQGLIEPDRDEAHDGRLRRYYRLTQDGRRALAEEAEENDVFAKISSAKLHGFIVWVPKLGAHQPDVAGATPTVPDPRAAHYRDGTG